MNVAQTPIEQVIPYARNPRKNDAAIAKVAASIREFGFRQPIVVDEAMTIIVGHTRLEAARQLGMADVPVHIADGLSAAQIKAYRLADNRVAQEAEWDNEMLAVELGDLGDMGFDLGLTGFTDDELAALLAESTEEGLTDEDAAPEPQPNPITEPGEMWMCGNHRVVCGDSTVATDVERVLGGVTPLLMVTDPPYGVEYDSGWRESAMPEKNTHNGARGKVENDDTADWRDAWALFPGDVAYVWHAGNKANIVADSLTSCDLHIRAQIIWVKHQFVISRGHYHPHHEPCWYAVRKGKTGHWGGGRKQSTVWQIDKPLKSETGHSTQKPVECMRRPIENNSAPGQPVYDPFLGSGTTMIAAETTGRVCYGLELSPAYVDVIVKRWQEFTGKTATLDGDGRTFAEVSEQRSVAHA